jgi:hypothetical protein
MERHKTLYLIALIYFIIQNKNFVDLMILAIRFTHNISQWKNKLES